MYAEEDQEVTGGRSQLYKYWHGTPRQNWSVKKGDRLWEMLLSQLFPCTFYSYIYFSHSVKIRHFVNTFVKWCQLQRPTAEVSIWTPLYTWSLKDYVNVVSVSYGLL